MTENQPKKTDPLTPEEMTEAADQFFPLFDIIHSRMPSGSTAEDTLKVMEGCAKLGHKIRADKKQKKRNFGFNKESKD